MNKDSLKIMLVLSFLVFISSDVLGLQSKESLLQAWETMQKNDPKTTIFQKLGDKRYKFKTELFPFDGELKVLNIVIDDKMFGYDGDRYNALGVVEVELIDLPEDFFQKHAYSYSVWSRNNTLYFDNNIGKWLPSEEYFEKQVDSFGWWDYFDYTWIIVLIAIIALSWLVGRRATKNMKKFNKEYMDVSLDIAKRSIQLSEGSQKILKEILELLKSKK